LRGKGGQTGKATVTDNFYLVNATVLRSYLVRNPAGNPAIQAVTFHDFSQYFQSHNGIISGKKLRLFKIVSIVI
jgi:hypothetical protein